jgi:RNA polymerase sigma-70 factor (ECF subfamily)
LRQTEPAAPDEFERARAGEPAAFAALVRRQQRLVYGIALRMLGNAAHAEDLAQEVFLQLYRNLAKLASAEHVEFWLRRVTTHRAIDRLRAQRLMQWAPLEAAADIPAGESGEDALRDAELRRLVLELPPAARAVVLLRYQQDLEPTEIARTLDMPLNTVKSHLKRSLAVLRGKLLPAAAAAAQP